MDSNNNFKLSVIYIDLKDDCRIIQADEFFYELTGYDQEDISAGRVRLATIESHNYRDKNIEMLLEAASSSRPFCLRQPLVRKDGSLIFVHCIGEVTENARARLILTLCNCQSRMEQSNRILDQEISIQREKLRIISENSDDVYFDYDALRDTISITADETHYPLDDDNSLAGYINEKRAKEHIHPKDYEMFMGHWEKLLKKPCKGSFEFRTNAYDDDYTWYNMTCASFGTCGTVERVVGRITSIQNLKNLTKKINKDSQYINYLIETDSLTGLLNRKGFTKQANELLDERDENAVYAVIYSDINDFSYVNENFGYEEGNKMLKDFADCITEMPTNLLGCRIYSDYFIGLFKANTREELIKNVESRNIHFTQMQKQKYPASDIRISCGMYIIRPDDNDINAAIDNANLARRNVKHSSNIICGVFSPRMKMQRLHEQEVCNELHSAIESRHIEMFLQPKFHLSDRTIIGAEALARWRNDNGTYKLPYEFIPVLEKVGYIDELDFFIYGEVLRTMERWKKDGRRILPISVNFSQHHIAQEKFVEKLVETADKFDVDKSNIEIEITESSFSGDTQALFSVMGRLRGYGFKVSIDDFGIGYSTLSVLMNAPVDIVKIDKSFIDNIEKSKLDRDFVSNMCSLINTAHKDIIFEGVETDAQADILSESGYTKAQGWLFDKAIPVSDFDRKYMY